MHGTCKYVVDVLNTLHWSDHEYSIIVLFGFGSVEIAQKDMCCVQVINVEQIVGALVTDCVHTTGACTRVPCW